MTDQNTRRRLVGVNEQNMPVGQDHPRAKLTQADVDRIFALREAGLSYGKLAARFGVSVSTIVHVLNAHTWVSIPIHFRPAKPKRTKRTEFTKKG